jgi:hypothetical protein
MMSFHRQTLELLGYEPALSPEAVAVLTQVERQRGFRFPAALWEWYSLDGAVPLLARYSNADPPVRLAELGGALTDPYTGEPMDLLTRGLLPIRFENQAVCVWAVRLGVGEDPEVVVDYDSGLRDWLWCASSFSSHVYCWVWDYSFIFPGKYKAMANANSSNEAALLGFFRSEFQERPSTGGWPSARQYRFEREGQRILLWTGDRANCFLAAPSTDLIVELVRCVHQAVPTAAPFVLPYWADRQLSETLAGIVWSCSRSGTDASGGSDAEDPPF